MVTNAIANAGLRVRWNIWNLYIHLCWQTVEQQFIPALAIASAVTIKFKKSRQTTDKQNIKRLFVHWKLILRETRVWQSRILFTTILKVRREFLGVNCLTRISRLKLLGKPFRLDNFGATLRLDCFAWQFWESWEKFAERLSSNLTWQFGI